MPEFCAKLNHLESELKNNKVVPIYQKDFKDGTYIISHSGHYKLMEDITFNPNPENDYLPKPGQSKYAGLGYTLGFFTIISITCENVLLDLNNKKVEASNQFTLKQRFFSCIELGDSPFPLGAGPGNFGKLSSATNVIITNGILGRSSHHGIHGNNNTNIYLNNLHITDFEFVGIALNGATNIFLKDVTIENNRLTPVLSTFSAARFATMFSNYMLNKYNNLLNKEQIQELEKRKTALISLMDKSFKEVITNGSTQVELFSNKEQLPDGNVYGILIKNPGIGVNDFAAPSSYCHKPNIIKTENVCLENVNIKNLRCKVDEVIGISNDEGKGAQVDVAGAVFRIEKVTDNFGRYKADPLSDLQIYLGELAINLNIPIGKNNLSSDLIQWTKNKSHINILLNKGYKYKCGGDSMFHFNKGAIGMRFDGLKNLEINNSKIDNIRNSGLLGNDLLSGNKGTSHDESLRTGYCGSTVTGINLSFCEKVKTTNSDLLNLNSDNGDCIGINILFSCKDVMLESIRLKHFKAGNKERKGYNYYGKLVDFTDTLPNKIPQVICIKGLHQQRNVYVEDVSSF